MSEAIAPRVEIQPGRIDPGITALTTRTRLVRVFEGKKLYGLARFTDVDVAHYYNNYSLGQPFFRLFHPIDYPKNRRLNRQYGNEFDIFRDTLMDYPTIIAAKLGRLLNGNGWRKYHSMMTVNIGICNGFGCWHCYVDDELKSGRQMSFYSAEQIVHSFFEIREQILQDGYEVNILT